MIADNKIIEFTGEFYVPGKTEKRIEDDHLERYRFASAYAYNKNVIDIACGYGYGGPMLIGSGANSYLGVDICQSLIENARDVYRIKNINYEYGDICNYENGKMYDLAVCFETIEHIKNYRSALIALYNKLNDNGVLLISSPNRNVTSPTASSIKDKPANVHHVQEFTIEELVSELRSVGFIVDECDVFGQRSSLLYFKSRLLAKIVSKLYGDLASVTSPVVKKIYFKVPRYFIVVARKATAFHA